MEDSKRASNEYLDKRSEAAEERRINRESALQPGQAERRGAGRAASDPQEQGGDIRHMADTGLPPGVQAGDLWDPGSQNAGRNAPVKNGS